jgi:hypothetical protein
MATPWSGVRDIERAITAYLQKHPQALDTERGIREWWLRTSCARYSEADVHLAIQNLVARGALVTISLPDGSVAYALGPSFRRFDQT